MYEEVINYIRAKDKFSPTIFCACGDGNTENDPPTGSEDISLTRNEIRLPVRNNLT